MTRTSYLQKLIIDAVEAHPGIGIAALARRLRADYRQVQPAVTRLRRRGLLDSAEASDGVRLFAPGSAFRVCTGLDGDVAYVADPTGGVWVPGPEARRYLAASSARAKAAIALCVDAPTLGTWLQ